MTDPTHRPRCYRCRRPTEMCYCANLPRVETRTRVVILQHPHERDHPFGTVRLARLCMPHMDVHVPDASFSGTFNHPVEVAKDAAVLYPHPDATDLATIAPEEWPSTLIAIDGTWGHAKRVYRDNLWLHARRHVRLQPEHPSRYRLRKGPRPDYISTLEALVQALEIIEPETPGLDLLMAAFDGMIDRQIAHRSSREVGRVKTIRAREPRALSPLLRDPRLVVVHAETLQLDAESKASSKAERQLVHWVGGRLDETEIFEAIVRPESPSAELPHLGHLGLSSEEVHAGVELHDAAKRFHAFLDAGAPLASWTATSLDRGGALVPATAARALLKTNYCNFVQNRAGELEDVVFREALPITPNSGRGRAAARLANSLAIARWLRSKLPGSAS